MSHQPSPFSAKIHVLAPAGPVPVDKLRAGMKVADRHGAIQWQLAPNVEQREGYFAGDDAARLAGILGALRDPEAHTAWCARGGYGTTRLLTSLSQALQANPRKQDGPRAMHPKRPFIAGFSDVTALLCWAWTHRGAPGVHGPVLTQLASVPLEDQQRAWDAIAGEPPPPLEVAGDASCVSVGGSVEGRLIIGNLEVLRSLIGTPSMPSLDGCILALEEVGERPYRIDRALTHLHGSGALRGVRGVALGQFIGCLEPEGTLSAGASALEVAHERLERLEVPVVSGFPFGHDPARNAALIFGGHVRLEADHGTLISLEGLEEAARP